jgi:hypothetical protein
MSLELTWMLAPPSSSPLKLDKLLFAKCSTEFNQTYSSPPSSSPPSSSSSPQDLATISA